MNLRFTQLTLGPVGWALVLGAGAVLGYGLSTLGLALPIALMIGIFGLLGTLLFLDRRAAKQLTRPRRGRTRRGPRNRR